MRAILGLLLVIVIAGIAAFYLGFIDMFKYGAIAVAVIVAFVIFLIH